MGSPPSLQDSMRKTRPTGVRRALACPGKADAAVCSQMITSPESSAVTLNVQRQPIRRAMNVAAGVPSARATGVPPSAMVRALPCR